VSTYCREASPQPTPNGWSEVWEMAAATHRDSPRCCSMRGRRFTWQESPVRWLKASAARARWWRRAPRERRSIGCAKRRLVFPDDADDDALDDHIAFVEPQRLQRVVGGLQPDPAARLTIEAFDRGTFSMDEGDHGLPGVGLVAFLNDDVIPILDVFVDHGVPAHLEHIATPAPRQQFVRDSNGFVACHRLNRVPGGDESEQRQLRGAGLAFGR